jgi:hypothetical protein
MATQSLTSYLRRATAWLGYAFDHHFIIFFLLVLTHVITNELQIFGPDVSRWDSLYVSGWITVVIGIRLARNLPGKIDETISRLVNRGSTSVDVLQLSVIKEHFRLQANTWAQWGGLSVAVATLIMFYLIYRFRAQISMTIISTLLAYVVGLYVGRALFYGRLAHFFRKERVTLKVQPGHLDGVAGLKPIGTFYFFQAMLLAIPAIYLAVWEMLISFIPHYYYRYGFWRGSYAGWLGIALMIEILAFLLPLSSFHQEMQHQKAKLLEEADDFSHRIVILQAQLIDAKTEQERKTLQEQLSLMTERYYAIEKLPTWPVDVKVRRKFALSNFILFLPLVGQLLSTTMTEPQKTIWQQLQDIVTKLLQG